MKYFIVMILCLFSLEASSQARVGMSIDEVKKDFPLVEKIDSITYKWETTNAYVYYITSRNIVLETVIYPKSPTDERKYIDFYNRSYMREGYAQWVFQTESLDTVYIFKMNRPNGSPFFVWTYYPDLSISRDVKTVKKGEAMKNKY